ncbi:MAG: hypothetical protein Fur0021_34090 [Candidatus Promineifilaceae bacterium]
MIPIYIQGKRVKLEAADLIQTGGEGMVFRWQGQAVKVYHQPQPQHSLKLAYWQQEGLSSQSPPALLGPTALVYNRQREVAGFVMPALPSGAFPLKQLANPHFTAHHQLDPRHAVAWLQHVHATLTRLHQVGIVVGDLNDQNLFGRLPLSGDPVQTFWVDVDSYQFGGFPCPVALDSFLDPHLYDMGDFSQKPCFSPSSDWYAFFVLLVKSLLQVHPYGGVHHVHKTLMARAHAGITILSPEVTYPQRARPIETLSDDLLHQLQIVFAQGQRPPFPSSLLNDYAQNLIVCTHCGQIYPQQRAHCPTCRQRHTPPPPTFHRGQLLFRLLLDVEGDIVQAGVLPSGQIQAIIRSDQQHRLVRVSANGGQEDIPLFSGQANYRFAFWGQHLAVNQTGTNQLLLLAVAPGGCQIVSRLQTATFQDESVFAASDRFLYRLANGYLMRGQWQQGQFVEAIVADARRQQTQFWAAPDQSAAAGFYRLFNAYYFFLTTPSGAVLPLSLPAFPPHTSMQDSAALFSPSHIAILLQTVQNGQQQQHVFLFDHRGQPGSHWQHAAAHGAQYTTLMGKALIGQTLLHATDDGILKENSAGQTLLADSAGHVAHGDLLHAHPQGLLIQQTSRLWLAAGR